MFRLQAAHTWTKARFRPRSISTQICMSRFVLSSADQPRPRRVVFPLFRSIARSCSFIVFKLHQTSLSFSVVEPSHADVSLVSSGLPALPLCNFRPGELVTLGDALRDCSTCETTFFGGGNTVAPSSTTVSTALARKIDSAHRTSQMRNLSVGAAEFQFRRLFFAAQIQDK